MFALSDSEPTSLGFVARVDPTIGDVLEAGYSAGKDTSLLGYSTRVFDNFLADEGWASSLARQEMGMESVEPMAVEELNKKYGLPGLTFDRPITEEAAKLQSDRQKKLLHYSYLTSELPTSFLGLPGPGEGFTKSLAAFGANVAGSLANPLDFALTFVPWVGEAKATSALGRGMVAAERLPFVAKFPVAAPAIINNLVSQSIIEVPRALGDIQEKGAPDWKGIATDIVVGGAVAEGLRQAGLMVAKLTKGTFDAALRKGLADAQADRPIDVSANIQQDPNVVRGDVEATLRRDLEAKIRQAPDFEAKVKETVDSMLKDRAFLEKRLDLIKKSEVLSDADALVMVREQVAKEYSSVYAAAEARLRVTGDLGQVNKTGARKLALDFLEFVDQLSPSDRKPFVERAARVKEALGPFETNHQITSLSADRVATALGLKYDWRLDLGIPDPSGSTAIPDMFTASPIRDVYSEYGAPSKGKAKLDSSGIIVGYAVNDALRDSYINRVLGREEQIQGLVKQEMDRRILEHAKALQAQYAEAAASQKIGIERKLGSPELNTWLAEDKVVQSFKEDVRFKDPAVAKTFDRGAEPKVEDAAAEKALASEELKELESHGELTAEEKAFIEAFPEDESEDFVSAIVDAATGCITGKAIGGK